jgi:hypothetical protein
MTACVILQTTNFRVVRFYATYQPRYAIETLQKDSIGERYWREEVLLRRDQNMTPQDRLIVELLGAIEEIGHVLNGPGTHQPKLLTQLMELVLKSKVDISAAE